MYLCDASQPSCSSAIGYATDYANEGSRIWILDTVDGWLLACLPVLPVLPVSTRSLVSSTHAGYIVEQFSHSLDRPTSYWRTHISYTDSPDNNTFSVTNSAINIIEK